MTKSQKNPLKAARGGKDDACPICRKPASDKVHPFCSVRCQRVDLSRWLTGVYAVPGDPVPAADGADDDPEG